METLSADAPNTGLMDGNGKPGIDGKPKCPKAKLSGTDGAVSGETKTCLGYPESRRTEAKPTVAE